MQHKSAKIHKMHQIALHSIMISHHRPSCNLQANLAATCQKVLHLSTPASCFAPQLCEAIEGLGGRRSLNPHTTRETCERFSCRLCQVPVQNCSTHEDQQSHSFRFGATEQRCNNSKQLKACGKSPSNISPLFGLTITATKPYLISGTTSSCKENSNTVKH